MYGSCMRAGVYTSCAHGRFKLMMSIAKSTCKQTVTRYVYSHKFYLYIICSRTYTDITKCQLLYATMTTYGNYEHTYGKNSTLSSYRLRQKQNPLLQPALFDVMQTPQAIFVFLTCIFSKAQACANVTFFSRA